METGFCYDIRVRVFFCLVFVDWVLWGYGIFRLVLLLGVRNGSGYVRSVEFSTVYKGY